MSSTRFIIIRHGETEWNLQGREMGQLDSPLTTSGIEGAKRLAERLVKDRFDVLYSSDLGRALSTSKEIASRSGHTIIVDDRLRERNMGIFQGLTYADRLRMYPEECAAYQRVGSSYVIPEGESADERVRRGIECFEDLARRHSGETVVAVTHGGILMGFFEYVFGLPFGSGAKFRRPHVALNLFTYSDGRWVLDTWGDVSHLTLENQDRPNQALQTTPVTRSEI